MPSSPDNCSPDWGQSDFHQRMQAIRDKQLKPIIVPPDNINQPAHYMVGGIETIDYMMAKSSPEEFKGHLRLTAIKYLSRAGHKDNVLQEYKKSAVYLNWLINYIETGSIK
jgi:hypothetical protein